MSEEIKYVGKITIVHSAPPYSSVCSYGFEVLDLKVNPELGVLEIYAVCGRRKREHKKVLLSAGAKAVLREALSQNASGIFDYVVPTSITAAYIRREGRKDKIIVHDGDVGNQVLLLLKARSGFRGWVWIDEHTNGTVLVQASAAQALGSVLAAVVHLRPGQFVVIERTGRLYGTDPYVLIMNKDGEVVMEQLDDLSILDEIIGH